MDNFLEKNDDIEDVLDVDASADAASGIVATAAQGVRKGIDAFMSPFSKLFGRLGGVAGGIIGISIISCSSIICIVVMIVGVKIMMSMKSRRNSESD